MFSHIGIPTVLLVDVSEAFEAAVWHVFLVAAPTYFLVFQEIYYGRDIGGEGVELIVVDAEVVAANRSDIVW
jgi:hypothetical protein